MECVRAGKSLENVSAEMITMIKSRFATHVGWVTKLSIPTRHPQWSGYPHETRFLHMSQKKISVCQITHNFLSSVISVVVATCLSTRKKMKGNKIGCGCVCWRRSEVCLFPLCLPQRPAMTSLTIGWRKKKKAPL